MDILHKANDTLTRAERQLAKYQAGELVAEDLRETQNLLGQITGEFSSDDLLGRIFTSFCIGK
jgi:tRNA modification GTPase